MPHENISKVNEPPGNAGNVHEMSRKDEERNSKQRKRLGPGHKSLGHNGNGNARLGKKIHHAGDAKREGNGDVGKKEHNKSQRRIQ
jgi:hypothetical protein